MKTQTRPKTGTEKNADKVGELPGMPERSPIENEAQELAVLLDDAQELKEKIDDQSEVLLAGLRKKNQLTIVIQTVKNEYAFILDDTCKLKKSRKAL